MTTYRIDQEHVRAVLVGLGLAQPTDMVKPKRQLILGAGVARPRVGEELDLISDSGVPIGPARVTQCDSIEIEFGSNPAVTIAGKKTGTVIKGATGLGDFARADGFPHWARFRQHMGSRFGWGHSFLGIIVYWEPRR